VGDEITVGEIGRTLARHERDIERVDHAQDMLRDGLDKRIDERIDRALQPFDKRIAAVERARASALSRWGIVIGAVVGIVGVVIAAISLMSGGTG
jgi:hypothetical protein